MVSHYYIIGSIILLLPILAFVIIALFNRVLPRQGDWIGTASMTICALLAVFFIFLPALNDSINDTESWPPDPNAFEYEWMTVTPDSTANATISHPFRIGMLLDNLTACMLIVVTIVSACVHWFSLGYMKGDRKYGRYFAGLSLFTTSMLGLILSDNLLTLYISWEIMGLASYLLIGHFFWKKSASDAAIKAFITTRLGDIGMFIGILLIYWKCGSFNFEVIFNAVADGAITGSVQFWAALGLFFGAMGKSAQFPLHVWLPDAMEGPTPVSALIHAATMVAAGVYLVGRMFVFFPLDAFVWIAYIGAFTAIFSATIALVQDDIKKVLAYSTVSQLGYMMLGLGVGGIGMTGIEGAAGLAAGTTVMLGWGFAMHHLLTHAYFKAGLFLGSGSVIHAMHHEQSMSKYGGLVKKLPLTFATFLICTLALTGMPYVFSGFFSKDGIIAAATELNYRTHDFAFLRWAATIAACLTAFYMFRLIVMTFFGKPRDLEKHHHAHESPWVMVVPLILLAALSGWWVGKGFNPLSHGESWFQKMNAQPYGYEIVYPGAAHHEAQPAGDHQENEHAAKTPADPTLLAAGGGREAEAALDSRNVEDAKETHDAATEETGGGHGDKITAEAHSSAVMGSFVVFTLGLLLAVAIYSRRFVKPETLANAPVLSSIHRLLLNKYYIDELYQHAVVNRTIDLCNFAGGFDMYVIDFCVNFWGWFYRFTSFAVGLFDNGVVDGAVNGSAWSADRIGRGFALLQTGRVRNYILAACLGLVALVVVFVIW